MFSIDNPVSLLVFLVEALNGIAFIFEWLDW